MTTQNNTFTTYTTANAARYIVLLPVILLNLLLLNILWSKKMGSF